MADEWIAAALGELCEFRAGSVFKPGLQGQSSGRYPFVKVSDMNLPANAVRIQDANNWVSAQDVRELRARPFPPGTVVFAKIGEALRQNRLRQVVRETIVDNNMMGAVPRASRVDPLFFYYVLSKFDFSEIAQGTALPYLTVSALSGLTIEVPPLPEQRAIARILGALDDKIELNRRMNETLETIARALFANWRGGINESLERRTISDLITNAVLAIGDGYRAKNEEFGSPGLPFMRAGELNNGFDTDKAESLSKSSVARAAEKVSRTGDVAFTSKGTIGRFARVTERTAKFVYSPQVCFWRSIDAVRLRPSLLYLWMLSDDFQQQVEQVANQTDMAPYVSLRDQRSMTMPVFGPDQHPVADVLDHLLERQSLNADQNKTLESLRDTLLPKLISGEVRIEDTERVIREHA
jgi:type I restriction enzyme S subunit